MRWLLLLILCLLLFTSCTPQQDYNPQIDPAEFTIEITNPLFTIVPGQKFVYESLTDEGLERIEVIVLDETKTVLGVETRVVWDRVWLNDELIEDTRDWYAQDLEGNVWYFGEETAEYENGEIVSTIGAWEAGVDGAKPGIIMLANPQMGDSYRQEYYVGEAEDQADVLAVDQTVTIDYGEFTGCLQTLDYTRLDPDTTEYKYYCPEIGNVVLEVNLQNGQRVELVSVEQS